VLLGVFDVFFFEFFHPVSRAETPPFREGRKRGSLVVFFMLVE
jgi:hypothetical protein